MKHNVFAFGLFALLLGASAARAQAPISQELNTRYPIVLSHHWGGTSNTSFLGDEWDGTQFNRGGIKAVLEAGGATVYQPDKIPFGDHIVRGRLLYKKCEVTTPLTAWSSQAQQQQSLDEALCLRGTRRPIDGVFLRMQEYCADPAKRAGKYASESDCRQNVKVNIICHSQGCPDSRYMISGMVNELSGKPMADHVASWTSLAGANKGTMLADVALGLIACTTGCDESLLTNLFAYLGFIATQQAGTTPVYNPFAMDSARALTRKYMTKTMDLGCNPAWQRCAPSFNEAYPNSPKVFYQAFSHKIDRFDACNEEYGGRWFLDYLLEGSNDGLIAVDSQRFSTTGYGFLNTTDNVRTNVLDRGLVWGESTGSRSYPGMAHMALSTHPVAGLAGPACAEANDEMRSYHFSREAFFEDIVRDLKARGS